MIIENTEALRDWLTVYLEPLCDADPQALAKYVMALIKKDKPERELKNSCLDQLEVFLLNNTISFVDTLFETIGNLSYLKSTTTSATTTSTSTPTTTTITTTTTTPKSSSQTSVPPIAAMVPSETSAPVINKSPELVPNKSSEPQNSQTNPKSDSIHESSNKLRDNKRNRSRSRSRSPLRNTRRNDFDRRLGPVSNRNNGSAYFNDDRRHRRGGLNNRRAGNQRFSGYRNERDYRRQRDLKRNRSRSRSYSSESLSRSRSRSRSRSWSRDRESPNTKRSRPSSRPASRTPSPSKAVPKTDAEKSKKCRDYEEKGFCLKGHLCPYDHGNDPVVLDSNVSAALGFGANTPSATPMIPIPNAGIPPNAPNSYLAEPYNPEAPGMDAHPNVQRPPPPPMGGHPRMPPPHHFWGPMHMRGPMPPGPPGPPHQFMPPPGRPRELIGVPTIDNNRHHNQSMSNRTVIEPNMGHRGGIRGGMIKHMGRGGYRNVRRVANDSSDKSCLEVRKIPSNMNTISHLNQHFSKFGTIVNLQVCHEGDPEAALVQYASHVEALAGIRSTEAVLNNRFIKVFWHSKEQQQQHEQTFPLKSEQTDEGEGGQGVNSKGSIKDRLGPKVSETESVLTAVNSLGSISRTVFDPSKLKKNNTNNQNKDNNNTNVTNNSNESIPDPNNPLNLRNKSSKTDKTNRTQKQIYNKQYKLLEELINNQKQLMNLLEKSTNENEKKTIKDTIDGISNKIQLLYDSIRKVMSQRNAVKKPQTREELMEEILNTDLDMFIKMQNNDLSYVELANKFAKLKKKEKTFGFRGRGAKTYPRRGRGVIRRGGYYGRGANPLLKVDRRTRKLLIPNINEDDITDLLEHLAQFSDVEVIEPSSSGAVVTFKTRLDAEKAIQNMSQIKFKENFQLNYSWFDENIYKSDKNITKPMTESKSANEGNEREMETLAEDLLDFEEDDTEDESEARNWKA